MINNYCTKYKKGDQAFTRTAYDGVPKGAIVSIQRGTTCDKHILIKYEDTHHYYSCKNLTPLKNVSKLKSRLYTKFHGNEAKDGSSTQ